MKARVCRKCYSEGVTHRTGRFCNPCLKKGLIRAHIRANDRAHALQGVDSDLIVERMLSFVKAQILLRQWADTNLHWRGLQLAADDAIRRQSGPHGELYTLQGEHRGAADYDTAKAARLAEDGVVRVRGEHCVVRNNTLDDVPIEALDDGWDR